MHDDHDATIPNRAERDAADIASCRHCGPGNGNRPCDCHHAAAHWDIPVGILIPHADVADIWDTAILACGYWAADMQGAHGDPGAYYVREHEPQGGEYDYAITGRDIATAAARIIAGRIPVAPSIRQDIADGDYDGDAADVIIQVAAFGEIVYG